MTDAKPRILFIVLPLLILACTLTAQVTPPPQGSTMVAPAVKPTEQTATASPTPAPRKCQVKTGIEAGALNLRTCGAITCPVVIVLREGETLTQTEPQTVDGWLAIETAGGLQGWVNSKYVTCEVKP
jgi:hypothetical protein